jgi:hypothetical protein
MDTLIEHDPPLSVVQDPTLVPLKLTSTSSFAGKPLRRAVVVDPGPPEVGLSVTTVVALLTAKDCWAWGAAAKLVSPGWFASTTQVPTPTKLTVDPVRLHIDAAVESIDSVTGRPEVAAANAT